MIKRGKNTQFLQEDIEKNKEIAALAYIVFFVPLIFCPDSPFGRFHANQALLLLITGITGSIILRMISFIGWIITPFFSLVIFITAVFITAIFIIGVIGYINALNGKAKEIPVIGKYRII